MANFEEIKTEIQNNIKPNGTQAITGQVLQDTLLGMTTKTEQELAELESKVDDKIDGFEDAFAGVLTKGFVDKVKLTPNLTTDPVNNRQSGSVSVSLNGGEEYRLIVNTNNTINLTTKYDGSFVDRDFVKDLAAGTHIISYTPSSEIDTLEVFIANTNATTLSIKIQESTFMVKDGNLIQNPLMKGADPCMFKADDGLVYILCTSETNKNIAIYRSGDLSKWEYLGNMLDDSLLSEIQDITGYAAFGVWAPCVIKQNDLYIAYVSIANNGSASDAKILAFASADLQKWVYKSIVTTSENGTGTGCIDADVIRDADGKLWMFFGSYGGIFLTELSSDGLQSNGKFIRISAGNGKTEAPVIYYRKGYYYLFASRGATNPSGNYRVVVTRSKTLNGVFVDKNGGSFRENEDNSTLILSSPEVNIKTITPSNHGGYLIGQTSVDFKKGQKYILTFTSNNTFSSTTLDENGGFVDRDFVKSFPAGTYTVEYIPSADAKILDVYIPNTNATEVSVIISTENEVSVVSPGHCSNPIQDKNLRYWMAYHAHVLGEDNMRKILVQEIVWGEDGWPYFENNGKPEGTSSVIPKL